MSDHAIVIAELASILCSGLIIGFLLALALT
jgi:hypothetical protein